MRLAYCPTIIANHELRTLVPMAGFAGHVGIQAFDTVNKSMFLPKFDRTVGRWRLWVFKGLSQLFQYVIGTKRLGAGGDYFQNGQSWFCEAMPVRFAIDARCF